MKTTRREMIKSSMALAALALAQYPLSVLGFRDEEGTVLQFLDVQPKGRPMVQWRDIKNWITPTEDLFAVSHYNKPVIEADAWRLEIGGLVKRPRTLTLADLKARPRKSVVAALECSGNGSNVGFMGAIGNVKWTGTPLAGVLKDCGLHDRAIELVFFGADEKIEKIREKEYLQNFARSLSRADASRSDVLLAYELNDEPLNADHGAPVRLVVPGWFGIAWVKWLTRIEALDRRYMSKYMAREYVTLRGEEKEGRMIWRETSVGPIDVKSIVARAVKLKDGNVRLNGVAWTDGTPLKKVEVKVDDGPWQMAELEAKPRSKYGWNFFRYDWVKPTPGEHTVTSRATDSEGRMQPAAEDDPIKFKRTYWEANQQWPRKLRLE